MTPYDFVLINFHLLGGSIQGKTKLQKQMYFLGLLSDKLEDLNYRAHYYGPYSPDIAASVEQLRSMGFIEHSTSSGGAHDHRGFEVARNDYELTNAGRIVAELKINKLDPDVRLSLQEAVTKIKSAGDLDYIDLSIAAKAFFIMKANNRPMTANEVCETAKKFNWDVDAKQIGHAWEYLKSLDAIQHQITG